MSVLTELHSLSPAALIYATPSGPTAVGGTATPTDGVQITPGLDGHVLGLFDADVTVTGVTNFTADRSFTLVAWVRGGRHASTRRIVGRQNGSTWVTLDINNQGQPTARVASTAGNYSVTLTGPNRVDDGRWHLIALAARRRTSFAGLVDTQGINLDLWVDNGWGRSGYINPGIFSMNPAFGMTTPVIVGRTMAGDSPAQAEVGPVAIYNNTLTAEALNTVWQARPEGSTSGPAWGIRLG